MADSANEAPLSPVTYAGKSFEMLVHALLLSNAIVGSSCSLQDVTCS